MKGKQAKVSSITSGNKEMNSPNLYGQFRKTTRHEKEDVPEKCSLLLHIRMYGATHTFVQGHTYVCVNPHLHACTAGTMKTFLIFSRLRQKTAVYCSLYKQQTPSPLSFLD